MNSILVLADTNGNSYLAEEDGATRELAVTASLPQLAILMAEKVVREEKQGKQFSFWYGPIEAGHVIANRPTAMCRTLSIAEKDCFEEWYEARKQFIKLRNEYGF